MEDDINDLLSQSFKKEKKKSNFVKNVPYLIQMKKSENYDKLFQGVSVQDIASIEEWTGGGHYSASINQQLVWAISALYRHRAVIQGSISNKIHD